MSLLLLILSSQSMCVCLLSSLYCVPLAFLFSSFAFFKIRWVMALVERRIKLSHCDFIHLIK